MRAVAALSEMSSVAKWKKHWRFAAQTVALIGRRHRQTVDFVAVLLNELVRCVLSAMAQLLNLYLVKVFNRVRPSVFPFVSTQSFEPTGLWPWFFASMTIACRRLKVKDIGQGKTPKPKKNKVEKWPYIFPKGLTDRHKTWRTVTHWCPNRNGS